MSLKERFDKAVNVIRNLPKNGAYQPSHELQLRFYAYFKQATEGPNPQPRPSFWEVVKRAKWDAWTKLGNMTKDEAMIHYVEELRKIVETMSYTDNVANFVNSLDNFYDNVPVEDLEMLVGPIIEKIRSRPNSPLNESPLASRDTSPSRDSSPLRLHSRAATVNGATKHITSSLETSPASSYSASPQPPDTDDDEDEHFLDTQTEPDRGKDGAVKKIRPDEVSLNRPVSSLSSYSSAKKGPISPTTAVEITYEVKTDSSSPDLDVLNNRINSRLDITEPDQQRLTMLENCNGVIPNDVQCKSTLQGGTGVTREAFKRAIAKLTEEMESLQRRMAAFENGRPLKTNATSVHDGDRATLSKWWDLSLPTTAALLMWPVLILLMSKWMSNRRKH